MLLYSRQSCYERVCEGSAGSERANVNSEPGPSVIAPAATRDHSRSRSCSRDDSNELW